MSETVTDAPTVADLIQSIRSECGRSGAVEVLKLLREFPVISMNLEYPQPMFFDDAWVETIDALLEEANKI